MHLLVFSSRMGSAFQFRKCIEDALEYRHNKEKAEKDGSYFRRDIGMEHMLPVLSREMPIHVHAHRSDDICTAVRLAEEYNLYTCTDGQAIRGRLCRPLIFVRVWSLLTPRRNSMPPCRQ